MRNNVQAVVAATVLSCGIAGAAQADPDSGIGAIETRDYDVALRELMVPAKEGNVEAQFFLGGLYFNGDGVERDPAEGHQVVALGGGTKFGLRPIHFRRHLF